MKFKDHTYQLRKKIMEYTDARRQQESMEDHVARKPSIFKVNILGYGLQGEKISEYLALQKDNELENAVVEANAFKRRVRPLESDEQGHVTDHQFTTKMHQLQKGSVAGKIEPQIKEFFFIQELYSRLGLTNYLSQAGTPNPMSDILVVCPRYGFTDKEGNPIDVSEKAYQKADDKGKMQIDWMRANLAGTFPQLDSFRGTTSGLIKAMSETLDDVLEEKNQIDGILKQGMDDGKLVKRDTAAISDHILGARILGDFLRTIDYQGFLVTIPNPLDIFTYTMMSHSGLPPSRVIGIEDHDQTRFTYWFAKNLAEKESVDGVPRYSFAEINIPVFGQHNFNQRPNLERARFSGVDNLTGEYFTNVGIGHFDGDHEEIMIKTLEFTARDYVKRFKDIPQGTAVETGNATINAIYSIIQDSDLPEFRQRVAGYVVHEGQPLVDGIQAKLSYRGAFQVMDSDRSTETERQGLTRGIEQMSWLVNALGEKGYIDLLTIEEGIRREKSYSKRWQNMDWTPPYVEKVSSPTLEKEKQGGLKIGKLNVGTVGRDLFIADTIYTDNKK